MIQKFSSLMSLKSDRRGVTALEYGLIAGLVALAIVAGATTLGKKIGNTFTAVGNSLTN